MWQKCILASVLLALAGPGLAEERGVYLGYQGGSYLHQSEFGNRNDRGWAHGPYAGYRFHRHGALEVQHVFQKETDDERFAYEGEVTIVSLRPVLPVNENWEFYGKLGWAWIDGQLEPAGASPPGARSSSVAKDMALYAFGTRWAMWGLHGRVEYQFDASVFQSDPVDTSLFMLGIEYVF